MHEYPFIHSTRRAITKVAHLTLVRHRLAGKFPGPSIRQYARTDPQRLGVEAGCFCGARSQRLGGGDNKLLSERLELFGLAGERLGLRARVLSRKLYELGRGLYVVQFLHKIECGGRVCPRKFHEFLVVGLYAFKGRRAARLDEIGRFRRGGAHFLEGLFALRSRFIHIHYGAPFQGVP